jgi:molybdopterin/thiamine biosynthesis adenylyltransferase
VLVKPLLKPCHNVHRAENGDVYVGEAAHVAYKVKQPPAAFIDLLLLLDGSRTLPRIVRDLRNRHPTASQAWIETTIDQLHRAHLLIDGALQSEVLSGNEIVLYDRQMLHFVLLEQGSQPGFVYQERLKAQRVVVLGMGGWGTWLSLNLALLGFGRLTLVDGDYVDLSNLNRQVLYRPDHVGVAKVEAARETLNAVNPHVAVVTRHEFVEADERQVQAVIGDATLVFLAWANQSHFVRNTAEEIVHRCAIQRRIPIIEIAGDPLDVAVGPVFLNDGVAPCNFCIRDAVRASWYGKSDSLTHGRKASLRASPVKRANAWQSAPSLSIIAGIAANEATKVAAGFTRPGLVGRRLNLSLDGYRSSIEAFNSKPDCPHCAMARSGAEPEAS